jgi:hypothetical protein
MNAMEPDLREAQRDLAQVSLRNDIIFEFARRQSRIKCRVPFRRECPRERNGCFTMWRAWSSHATPSPQRHRTLTSQGDSLALKKPVS